MPINRLPPEVLAFIPMFRGTEWDLMNAMAVCNHWRRTFISTPNLWTKIICSKRGKQRAITPYVRAYLERSGSIPIDIQVPAHACRLLSPHTERISSLRVRLGRQSDLDELSEHLSKPAPILTKMGLHVGKWAQPTLALPDTFYEVFLSSVRTLTVRGATLSPGPCKLSQLTKFTMVGAPSVVLLDTLEGMPLLQSFAAEFDCSAPLEALPEGRVVTLPHLRDIVITTDENLRAPLTSPILPVLCLPNARRVSIHSTRAESVPHTPILPLLFEERLPGLSATPEVSTTLGKGFAFNIEFFGLHQSNLTISVASMMRFDFTQSTFGGAPFGSVRKLRVRFPGHSPGRSMDSVFVAMLRVMGGLEWLKMEQETMWPIAHWAAERDQAGVCPALVSLIVIDTDNTNTERCVRRLELVRKRAGVPIARVEVVNQFESV